MTELGVTGAPSSVGARRLDAETCVAGRLAITFVIDVAGVSLTGYSLLDLLLLASIIGASLQRVTSDPALPCPYARVDSDERRRQISINALAVSLDQPFETVRRRVRGLAEAGCCVIGPSGVYVPDSAIDTDLFRPERDRYARFWRFHEEVGRLGLIEPLSVKAPEADDPAAPVRAIGRLMADYFLRSFEHIRRVVRDPVTGLILMYLLRANWEHLAARDAARAPHQGRPVRTAEIARTLGVPYETTRRHVGWLIEHGYCRPASGGVVSLAQVLRDPRLLAVAAENLVSLRRLCRQASELVAANPRSQGLAQA